jgi:virginiamycin B lyase
MSVLSLLRYSRKCGARLLAGSALAGLVACSGGGSGPMPSGGGGQGGGGGSSSSQASVTWNMTWAPSRTGSIVKRQYLPATALSASITVIAAPAPFTTTTPVIEILNSPASTLTFTAPTGLDTFLIQTYDEQNALGNVLSKAFVTQTVSGGSANVVSSILNGVIASLALNVSPLQPAAGTASTMTVSATGYDADGNVIVGPGTYAQPIQLSISDPTNSAALSLSTLALQSPGSTATLSYNGNTLTTASVVGTLAGVAPSSVTIAPTPSVKYLTLPSGAGSQPNWITVDSANNLWVTEGGVNKIAERPFNVSSWTEFTIPTANSYPEGITIGSDGRIWFAEYGKNQIGAMTTAGVFSEYTTVVSGGSYPFLLIDRGDGNIWFTDPGNNHVGYELLDGYGAGETTLPTANSQPTGIAEGPDGYLYVTEARGYIGRIHDLFSSFQEVAEPVPSGAFYGDSPGQMVRGPDGNLWFVEQNNSEIGRINIPAFTITMFQTPSPGAAPRGITVGPDGALWFTEQNLNRIGRITTSGVTSEYTLETGSAYLGLLGIAIRSTGEIYFVCNNTGQVGKLTI